MLREFDFCGKMRYKSRPLSFFNVNQSTRVVILIRCRYPILEVMKRSGKDLHQVTALKNNFLHVQFRNIENFTVHFNHQSYRIEL